jgi:hypothetical protein
MPRTLTIQRSTVTSTEREKYLTGLSERKSRYAQANCKFWVFEEIGLPGAFVEFTEADSPDSIRTAHETISDSVTTPRIYQELEIA